MNADTLKELFERLHVENVVRPGIDPAAPVNAKYWPEATDWAYDDFYDYKNYFNSRTNLFGKPRDHETAMENVRKNSTRQ